MGRRVTVGVFAEGASGQLSITSNTVTSVETNSNLTLAANGTGIVNVNNSVTLTSGNFTINAAGDLRLADADSSAYVALEAPATVTTTYTIVLPPAVAARDKSVLTSNTSGVTSWEPAKTFEYSTVATSFNAVAFGGYFVNTTSGGVTATLPSSPAVGDTIRFLDVAKTFDSNALTVARNGNLIQGDAENLSVTSESAAFELIYSGSTFGWRIFSV
jgi:hypothetical protein